jgi:AhpD family alkylhydroperoxidase
MSDHDHRWGTDVQNELAPLARELRHEIPDVLKGFVELHNAAMAEGALDAKTKELIALAIAITERCDGCIAAHARGAVRRGATRQEVAETIGVTILMNGGPATVYGPRALAAYDDFATPSSTT